jgi:hypothetical protein
MRLDNRTANCQTHPHSLRFGGEKWLEDASDIFLCNTRPEAMNIALKAIF